MEASDLRIRERSIMNRLPYLMIAAGGTTVLAIARLLEPSKTGIGTHEQLGLPACVFHRLTGCACPSCGLTTSFAYAARFEFWQALLAQPFGLLLFMLTVAVIPVSVIFAYRAVPVDRWMHGRWTNTVLVVMLVLYGVGWVFKLVM